MDIRISKESEISVREQLNGQILYLIATEKLKPGQSLPSVREVARRLKIHHNTVSQAYQDLVDQNLLIRRPGSRMVVRTLGPMSGRPQTRDLDDLINATIRAAQESGFTVQQLRQRVRERLLEEPPDHLLVVEEESGLRELLQKELTENLHFPVQSCSPGELASNPGLAIGALVVSPPAAIRQVAPLAPKNRPALTITISSAEEHIERVRSLREASIIAVLSVSEQFLRTARGLLAPALGRYHSLQEFLLPLEDPNAVHAADLVFCDSIARCQLKSVKCIHYRVVSSGCLETLSNSLPAPADS